MTGLTMVESVYKIIQLMGTSTDRRGEGNRCGRRYADEHGVV
jgi:hypothetical protein